MSHQTYAASAARYQRIIDAETDPLTVLFAPNADAGHAVLCDQRDYPAEMADATSRTMFYALTDS